MHDAVRVIYRLGDPAFGLGLDRRLCELAQLAECIDQPRSQQHGGWTLESERLMERDPIDGIDGRLEDVHSFTIVTSKAAYLPQEEAGRHLQAEVPYLRRDREGAPPP